MTLSLCALCVGHVGGVVFVVAKKELAAFKNLKGQLQTFLPDHLSLNILPNVLSRLEHLIGQTPKFSQDN